MTVVIIPVGYCRDRHLDGVQNLVSSSVAVSSLYVLYSSEERFAKPRLPRLSVKDNADAISRLWQERSGLSADLRDWDPAKTESVARTLTMIAERHLNEEILIDVTSTTKTVMVVASLLSLIYGLKAYYVPGKEGRIPILTRTERMLDVFFGDPANSAKILSLFREHGKSEEKMRKLRKILEFGLAEATFELRARSRGAPQNEMVQFPSRPVIGFKSLDRNIMSTISDLSGRVKSIKALTTALANKGKEEPFTTVNNRVNRLEELGLVRTGGDRERFIELTEIGKGVTAGIKTGGQGVKTLSVNR